MDQTVSLNHLQDVVDKALTNLGLERTERTIVREVLMYAEVRGSSQGLIKIKELTVLPDADCLDVKSDIKAPSIARVDGGGHTGMFVLNEATTLAKHLVSNTGIALVSTHNTRSSTGSIGYYADKLASCGYISLVLAGSPKVMAAEGGIDPVFGTNPIAIAIPTDSTPLVLDMATAAITWFSVINARDSNTALPPDTAMDKYGSKTTNPLAAMSGALKTFGGAKGSGLALMFEFLTGVLGNASLLDDGTDNRSNTIIAIDPEVIDSGFRQRASDFIRRLKDTRSNPSLDQIRLPGEQSSARASQSKKDNAITIDAELYQHLLGLAQHD